MLHLCNQIFFHAYQSSGTFLDFKKVIQSLKCKNGKLSDHLSPL